MSDDHDIFDFEEEQEELRYGSIHAREPWFNDAMRCWEQMWENGFQLGGCWAAEFMNAVAFEIGRGRWSTEVIAQDIHRCALSSWKYDADPPDESKCHQDLQMRLAALGVAREFIRRRGW